LEITMGQFTLIVLGGGGHAAVVAEAAMAEGITLEGFLDDDPVATMRGLAPRLGSLSAASQHQELLRGHRVIIGIGEPERREALVRALPEAPFAPVVHPSAVVSPSARVGAGSFVGPLAVVHTGAVVGAHAIVNTGAVLEHDAVLGEASHLAPGAVLAGGVMVGGGALIGVGVCAVPGVRVGDGAVVGAGAVLIRDVEPGATVAGNPATPLTTRA